MRFMLIFTQCSQKFCQSFSAPENDKNESKTQWKSYNRKVENIYNLFKMAYLDGDTITKALRPVIDRFTNSVDRKVFNYFCDSFLKPVDRFVRFCTDSWLEFCPKRITQRIQDRITTRPVLLSDGMWIALKPGLSYSSLMSWRGILLKNPALSSKHFHIQWFNSFFQHLLIYQSGRFYALLTKMDVSKTVSPIDSQPDHHMS